MYPLGLIESRCRRSKYQPFHQITIARYENFLCDYENEADRLLVFLGLNRENPDMGTVVEKYRSENAQAAQKGLHFSKGKIGRFRQKMTPEQQEILAQKLGPVLVRMGYEI